MMPKSAKRFFGRHHALTYENRSRSWFWIGSIQNHRDLAEMTFPALQRKKGILAVRLALTNPKASPVTDIFFFVFSVLN
jgi:hypothetical protein